MLLNKRLRAEREEVLKRYPTNDSRYVLLEKYRQPNPPPHICRDGFHIISNYIDYMDYRRYGKYSDPDRHHDKVMFFLNFLKEQGKKGKSVPWCFVAFRFRYPTIEGILTLKDRGIRLDSHSYTDRAASMLPLLLQHYKPEMEQGQRLKDVRPTDEAAYELVMSKRHLKPHYVRSQIRKFRYLLDILAARDTGDADEYGVESSIYGNPQDPLTLDSEEDFNVS